MKTNWKPSVHRSWYAWIIHKTLLGLSMHMKDSSARHGKNKVQIHRHTHKQWESVGSFVCARERERIARNVVCNERLAGPTKKYAIFQSICRKYTWTTTNFFFTSFGRSNCSLSIQNKINCDWAKSLNFFVCVFVNNWIRFICSLPSYHVERVKYLIYFLFALFLSSSVGFLSLSLSRFFDGMLNFEYLSRAPNDRRERHVYAYCNLDWEPVFR